MKARLKVVLVFAAGCLWLLLLRFADWKLRDVSWEAIRLSSPWGEIVAVAISLGPPFVASILVLRRSFPLRSLHVALRSLIYSFTAVLFGIGAMLSSHMLASAFGWA
jgi:hypothetical protein